MAKIHLINGEKGGVGKSLFARVFLEYCRKSKKNYSVQLIDADRTNPDVGLIYDESTYSGNLSPIYFSDNQRESHLVDRIFELAVNQTVLVNLPAQVAPLIDNWLDSNNLLNLGKELGISFVNWFLCTGGYDSIELFKQVVTKYKNTMTHVLVRNHGLCFDWSHLDDDPTLKKLLDVYQIKTIKFPALSYRERNQIDAQKMTFAQAIKSDQFGIVSKQKIKMFLSEAISEIEGGPSIAASNAQLYTTQTGAIVNVTGLQESSEEAGSGTGTSGDATVKIKTPPLPTGSSHSNSNSSQSTQIPMNLTPQTGNDF